MEATQKKSSIFIRGDVVKCINDSNLDLYFSDKIKKNEIYTVIATDLLNHGVFVKEALTFKPIEMSRFTIVPPKKHEYNFYKKHEFEVSEIEVKYCNKNKNKLILNDYETAAMFCRNLYNNDTINLKEYFYVVYLNHRKSFLHWIKLSEGTIDSTTVDIKLLFSIALKLMASGIIISHNHPSDNTTPSVSDDLLTDKIKRAGRLFNIELVDHIIIGDECFYSYAEKNRI